MTDLESITKRLAEIQDELTKLPDDAFAAKMDLRAEQDQLRAYARAYREGIDDSRDTDELLAELRQLRHRLAEIDRMKIDMVKQSGSTGGAGPGADGWGGVQLNQQIDAAQGTDELRKRIGRIKGILTDRGVDVPEPE